IFYNKLYEEGLIDTSFGSYFTGKTTYGHSLILGESEDPKEVYNRIISFIERPVEEILLEDDFQRIKSNEIGGFLMGLDSIEFIANNFVEMYFSGFMLTDYLDVLESIEYEE